MPDELVKLQTRTSIDYYAMISDIGRLKKLSTSETIRYILEQWCLDNYQIEKEGLLKQQAARQELASQAKGTG
tara:strand:+ start:110 stop:328 length:219 start_codon:yes stop_codon:yes gene_type:complete